MSLIKVFALKTTTDDIHPVTKKAIIKCSYHTEADGKGELIKAVITDGSGSYFMVKDETGKRVLTTDEHATMLAGNNKRLGNNDLKRIKRRVGRFADRLLTMRKQINRLDGDEMDEVEQDAIINLMESLKQTVANALYTPLTGSAKEKVSEPDIF